VLLLRNKDHVYNNPLASFNLALQTKQRTWTTAVLLLHDTRTVNLALVQWCYAGKW